MLLPIAAEVAIARRGRAAAPRPVADELRAAEQQAAAAAVRRELAAVRPTLVLADVFDTLLVRNVHPEDVKRLAARRIVERYGLATSASEVYAARATLERELCSSHEAAGDDAEFRLRELALGLHAALAARDAGLVDVTPDAFAQAVLEVELAVERDAQSLDADVAAVLDEHVRAGGRLVLVSDFYLPASDLADLLTASGYPPDRYERLVVSSDTLRTKRSGRLFDDVLASVDVPASKVLVVGDNPWSDGASARARGLHALVLDRSVQRAHYEALRHRFADAGDLAPQLRAAWAGTGAPPVFPEFALTLAFAARELHRALHRDGVRDVLFLAREGGVLMRLCTLLDELTDVPDTRRLRPRYAFVSRRSTFLASLGPMAQESFDSLFRQYRSISLREFLLNLGFSARQAGDLATGAGLDPDTVAEDLPTSADLAALLADQSVLQAYDVLQHEQRQLLAAHLDPDGTVRAGLAPLAVVDVGWKGTIQDHLHAALSPPAGTRGYYLGLVAAGAESEHNRKTGVLFDFRRAEGRYYDVFDEHRAMYEVLLSAGHGSTARYEAGEHGGQPVLEPLTAAETRVAQVVAPVQQQLEERAAAVLRVLAGRHVDEDWLLRHVALHHARAVLLPRRRELEWFRELTHEENFGFFRQTSFGSGTRPTPGQRLGNALSLARRPRATLTPMFWPRLGLAELGLGPVGLLYSGWKARRLVVRR